MNLPTLFRISLAAVVTSASWCQAAPLVVSQGRVSQRVGTKLVDVNYAISGGVPPYAVTLQGSLDGGATWTLPVATVGGNVGGGVTEETNRLVTWNAGTDWAGQLGSNVKFKISAVEEPPTPTGFALIPAGPFQMGQSDITGPPLTVQVSAYYIGKFEVTKDDWDAVRTWGLTNGYSDLPIGNGKAANHPVSSIDWYSMVKWCNARSQKEGLTPCYTVSGAIFKTGTGEPVCDWNANGFRLPTEAEWEKAARGGVSGAVFPWGTDTISHSQANYYSSSEFPFDVSPTREYHPTYAVGAKPYSAPVGSFPPNGYGLCDVAGNVWEWCWDWYGPYPAGSPTDPRGASSGTSRTIRDGSWASYPLNCRTASRTDGTSQTDTYDDVGFRIAAALPSPASAESAFTLTNTTTLDTRDADYHSWIQESFPGNSDPITIASTADPDRDGIPNSIEMVVGGSPASSTGSGLRPAASLAILDLGNGPVEYFIFTYRRTSQSLVAGCQCDVQHSSGLTGAWVTAEGDVAGVKLLTDPGFHGVGIDRVRVHIPRNGRRMVFGRLRVTTPPIAP